MAPSEMVAWECGACTFTNKDVLQRDCEMCMTECPLRYDVVPGAGASATARTTTFDGREQARLAAASDAEEDTPPPAADEEPIAEGVPVVPTPRPAAEHAHCVVIERLVRSLQKPKYCCL